MAKKDKPVASGAGLPEMPDEIILDRDIYGSNRKGPVTFSHRIEPFRVMI